MQEERRLAATHWSPNGRKHDHFFSPRECGAPPSTWTPNTDVYETDEYLMVRMELSGISRDNLEISLQERLLIVRGMRPDPCRTKKCTFRQMEIEYGTFERRILVPRSVNPHAARAQFTNGFLQIALPKAPQAQFTTVTIILEQD
jgi:HSP20 family protein